MESIKYKYKINLDVLQDLKDLDNLFSCQEKWTKQEFGKDKIGNPVYEKRDFRNVCWSLYGGLLKVYRSRYTFYYLQDILLKYFSHIHTNNYNFETTFISFNIKAIFFDIKNLIHIALNKLEMPNESK